MKKLVCIPNNLGTLALCAVISILLGSCRKDEYAPMSATQENNRILIICNDETGKNLLNDKEFAAAVSAFGNESQAMLPCQMKQINGKYYLLISADLPNRKNVKFSANRTQGTAATEIILKIHKQKVTLKCVFQYQDMSKPPMPIGSLTSITIESIALDQRTIKRTGKNLINDNLVLALQIDKKGNIH